MNDKFDLKKYLYSQVLLEEIPGVQADEEELNALDKEISSAFASGLSSLQGQVAEVKKQVDEIDEDIQESVVGSLLISTLISSPKLLEIIGGIINKIASKFSREKGSVPVGDAFIHAGHYVEEKYLDLLKKVIKVTGMAKKANLKSEADIEKAARIMLYTILGAAAVSAGFASTEAIAGALAGKGVSAATYGIAKGSLAGLKGTEVIDEIKALKSKI